MQIGEDENIESENCRYYLLLLEIFVFAFVFQKTKVAILFQAQLIYCPSPFNMLNVIKKTALEWDKKYKWILLIYSILFSFFIHMF